MAILFGTTSTGNTLPVLVDQFGNLLAKGIPGDEGPPGPPGGAFALPPDPVDGDVKKVTSDITDQLGNYDEQLFRLSERIEDKHRNLQIKFAKLDSTMGRLKSQQNYVSQQLSALSNSPRAGGKDK